MILVLIVVLFLIGIAGLPTWPYSSGLGYGYYPSGLIGIIVVILIVLLLLGRV